MVSPYVYICEGPQLRSCTSISSWIWYWHCHIVKCACAYHFVTFKDGCWFYLNVIWNKIDTSQFGIIMKKWTSLGVDNLMVVSFWIFVSVISRLFKPYHCCVYGSFRHICLCINANKDVWLLLSGMMVISSVKNAHNFVVLWLYKNKGLWFFVCLVL